jgi:hypothetical protein
LCTFNEKLEDDPKDIPVLVEKLEATSWIHLYLMRSCRMTSSITVLCEKLKNDF